MIYAIDGSIDLRRALVYALCRNENAHGGVTIRAELPGGGVVRLDPYQVSEEGEGHVGIYCHKIDVESTQAEPVTPSASAADVASEAVPATIGRGCAFCAIRDVEMSPQCDLPWHRKAPVVSMSGARFAAIGRACYGTMNESGAFIERGAKSWQGHYAEALGVTTEWVRRCAKKGEVTGEPAARAKHMEELLPEDRKRWLRTHLRDAAARPAGKR